MLKFKLLVLMALFTLSFSNAQQDSSKSSDDWDWHWEWEDWEDWEDWGFDFGFRKTRPAISLQYGLAKVDRNDLQSQFVDPNFFELKLGYTKDKNAWDTDYIINHSYKFLYLANESNKLSGKEAISTEIESDMWRFGFGRLQGYGYKIGESSAIIPYYSYSMNWSRIDFQYSGVQTPVVVSDLEKLNLYDESFRFGTSNEGGVRIKVIDNLILDAGYERSIVFQRHLFWKWAGSAIIESAAQGLLDGFIHEIFESSPSAGPVVNFLLKNALAYGLYELRQEKMNWPFSSEAPIAYDQFKFGVTVVF